MSQEEDFLKPISLVPDAYDNFLERPVASGASGAGTLFEMGINGAYVSLFLLIGRNYDAVPMG